MSDTARWPAMMSRDDVAEYVSLHPSTISKAMADGTLKAKVFGRVVRIPKTEVDAWIETWADSDRHSRASRRPGAKGKA